MPGISAEEGPLLGRVPLKRLSEPGEAKHVELEDEPGSVTEHRMLARTA
jgi:hypothetical protein